jgi:hypothetical protein
MKFDKVVKSPVMPANHRWDYRKREGVYESDVTALVRCMLDDEAIAEDQRDAWERWRNDPSKLGQP